MLVDFSNLLPPKSPNWCLALPTAWHDPRARIEVPAFEVPLEKLREALIFVVRGEPKTNLLRLERESRQAEFEQRSQVFGFPDRIIVEFVELGPNRSSLAIYSQSLVGYWDLGVNRRRIRKWLRMLQS